jgi:hypothetical protein
VTTYAGSSSGVSGCVDGASSQVLLNGPIGVSVNTVGQVFITDGCSRIVMIATTGKSATLQLASFQFVFITCILHHRIFDINNWKWRKRTNGRFWHQRCAISSIFPGGRDDRRYICCTKRQYRHHAGRYNR